MRREDLYLNEIVEAVDHIATFIAGADFEAFQKSEMMRSAVAQKLAIICEAAAQGINGPSSRGPVAPNRRLSEHTRSRLLRDRLERSVAGCQESLPCSAGAGRRNHRCLARQVDRAASQAR